MKITDFTASTAACASGFTAAQTQPFGLCGQIGNGSNSVQK